jgi:hypothetical protein
MNTDDDVLNSAALAAAFKVTLMTITNWRQGSARRTPLPCSVSQTEGGRCSVTFKRGEVQAWAIANGLKDPWKRRKPAQDTLSHMHAQQRGSPQSKRL